MTTNENLRTMRRALGYSLRYVAARTGVAKSTISNIEIGKMDCGHRKIERLQAFYQAELAKRQQEGQFNNEIH